jgi:hypothetical protein
MVADDKLAAAYDPDRHGQWITRCPECPTARDVKGAHAEAPRIQGGLPGLRAHYLTVHPDKTPPPQEQP